MRKKRTILGILAVFVIAFAASLLARTDPLGAVGRALSPDAAPEDGEVAENERASGERSKPTSLPVGGVVLEREPFVVSVRATGRVEALRRAELSFPVSERIDSVHVREGDRVAAGQVLATLDPRPFEIARNEVRARLSNAETSFRIRLLSDTLLTDERRELIAHQAGLTEAREALARAELELAGTSLAAPFAGVVSSVEARVGERARTSEPLLSIVNLDVVRVRAEVLETDFGQIVTGAAARVRFPAFPREVFPGTVTAVGPEIDPERGTGVAYVEVENRDGRIKPGMYAEAVLAGRHYDDRIQVPREAVLERDRKLLVFRASDGRAEWQYVETGLETRDFVEITNGLAPGDTVLVEGHLTLAHGAPVKVALREE